MIQIPEGFRSIFEYLWILPLGKRLGGFNLKLCWFLGNFVASATSNTDLSKCPTEKAVPHPKIVSIPNRFILRTSGIPKTFQGLQEQRCAFWRKKPGSPTKTPQKGVPKTPLYLKPLHNKGLQNITKRWSKKKKNMFFPKEMPQTIWAFRRPPPTLQPPKTSPRSSLPGGRRALRPQNRRFDLLRPAKKTG